MPQVSSQTVVPIVICVACNVNVTVRIGSPGDDGDVVQQIVSAAQATVAGIQTAAQQAAAQAAPAVADAPPLPPPPDVPTVEPVPPDPVAVAVPVVPSVAAVSTTAGSDEDPPRRGASPLDGSPPHLLAPDETRGHEVPAAHGRGATTGVAPPAALVVEHAAPPAAERSQPERARNAGSAPRAPRPLDAPSSPAPPAPAPALLTGSALGGHGGGSNASADVATMTLAALLLFFLSRIRSIARPFRRAGPVTQPHPPG